MGAMRIDLHAHSAISDGTESPTDVVLAARRAGLDVLGLTDHDTLAGLSEARDTAKAAALDLLGGLELSCHLSGIPVHLLGYGVRDEPGELADELHRIREGRIGRIAEFCARLTALGMPITEAEVSVQAAGASSIGRPHIADVMVAKGYVATRRQAFDEWLADDQPAFVPRYYCPLIQGIALIKQAGGVSVLAHAWGRGSRAVLPESVITELVQVHGLDGIEVDHQDHDEHDRTALRALADRLGVINTGSSDYHGLGKIASELGCNTTTPTAYASVLVLIGRRGGHR